MSAALAGLIFLLVGCSDNQGVRLRQQAEKMLFEAERSSETATIQPQMMTPETVDRLQREYRGVVDFCYAALDSLPAAQYDRERSELSELAFRAASRVAQVYFRNRQYDSCVSIMSRLLAETDVKGTSRISTYINLGQALQSAGNWDSALAVYEYSVENFYPPVDSRGEVIAPLFNLPAHIFTVYARTGDSIAARMQLDNAEFYYRDLVKENPGTELERSAHSSLTNLYEVAGRWRDAITQLRMITDTTGKIMPGAKQRIADIYASRLKRPDSAIILYDELRRELVGRDTAAIPLVQFRKALAVIDQKKYASARAILVDIKQDFPRFYNGNAAVQSAIARTFELEGNWDRAETEYRFLLEKFDNSEEALDTYIYLIAWYEDHRQNVEAVRMKERAAAHFDRVAAAHRGTRLEASALTHKAELFRREKNWPRTAEVLLETFDKFPRTDIGYQAAVAASVIYREKMGQPKSADSVITALKSRLTAVDEQGQI